jgi:hypothetical protein
MEAAKAPVNERQEAFESGNRRSKSELRKGSIFILGNDNKRIES